VLAARLKRSHTTSCGCLKLERISTLNKTHGLRKTAEFTVWAMMRQRVLNPNNQAYRYYGARGITICAAWDSFEQFLADMGPRLSSSHSIDRIDTDGPYSPENCRWATREQQRNNRRDSLTLEYGGQTLPLAEWARVTGIKYKTLLWRVQHGRTPTEALAR
jgi:hypothetical protein